MLLSAVFIVARYVKILGKRERSLAVYFMRQFDSSRIRAADLTRFEEIDSFAQHLTKIGAIHFVDYEKVGPGCGLARRLEEPSLLDAKTQLLAVNLRGEPDDEVLVRPAGWN